MKNILIILLLFTTSVYAQVPTTFYAIDKDSTPVAIVVDGLYKFVDKNNRFIYEESFDRIFDDDDFGFVKAKSGDQYYYLQPKTSFIYKYPKELNSFFEGSYIVQTYYSKVFLIELNKNFVLDFENQIHARVWYTQKTGKKYTLVNDFIEECCDNSYPEKFKQLLHHPFRDIAFDQMYPLETMDNVENIFKVKKDGKYGVISSLGKYILKPEFTSIDISYSDEVTLLHTYFHTTKDGLKGIYNSRGQLVLEHNYKKFGNNYYEPEFATEGEMLGFFPLVKNKIGYINVNGKLIIEPKYDRVDVCNFNGEVFKEGIPSTTSALPYEKCTWNYPYKVYYLGFDDKKKTITFISPEGQELGTYNFQYIFHITPSGHIISESNKVLYGLLGPGACLYKEPVYDYIDVGKNTFILVKEDNKSDAANGGTPEAIIIDSVGNQKFIFDFEDAWYLGEEKEYVIARIRGEKYGVFDLNNSVKDQLKWVVAPEYNMIQTLHTQRKYLIANKEGKSGIIDVSNTIKLPFEYEEIARINNDYFSVKKDNVKAIYDFTFRPCSDFIFDKVVMLSYYGYDKNVFLVHKNGKVGVYDAREKKLLMDFVLDEKYNLIGNFGMLCISQNNLFGLMNPQFSWVVQPQYKDIKYDKDQGRFVCIDKNGNTIYLDKSGNKIDE
ncbi:MAG TPA: WG repeat-containing protein [Cytophagaceae bacterium]